MLPISVSALVGSDKTITMNLTTDTDDLLKFGDFQLYEETIETSVSLDDNANLNNYVLFEDLDSNIGSMVSITEETNEAEFNTAVNENKEVYENRHSWPTLEILPGGVIKSTSRSENNSSSCLKDIQDDTGRLLYSCAICSKSFQYLFCLVRHVKWHESNNKNPSNNNEKTHSGKREKCVCLHSKKRKSQSAGENSIRKSPKF